MALTKLFAESVKARVARDPAFALAMLEEAEAEIARLRAALGRCLMGGNHLATHIDHDGPDWRAETEAGLQHYGAGPRYDAWCCWRAIMQAREMADPR